MSSSFVSVGLLAVLGVVLALGGPVPFHMSEQLKKTHAFITAPLNLTHTDIVTNPLFSSVIRSINTSCQRGEEVQLMNVTLDVYMQIFSSILQNDEPLLDRLGGAERQQVANAVTHLQNDEPLLDRLGGAERQRVVKAVKHLQLMMLNLRRKLRTKVDHDDVISRLRKIKVDDPLVQRTALAEFKEIYQAASVIGSC